jgi:sRNA-binding protein
MLATLPGILGCSPGDVPIVFKNLNWPRTLKIGIDVDIRQRFPAVDGVRLARWLKFWTRNPAYVQRLAKGVHRHNLDGHDAGLIDAAHVRYARRKLIGSTEAAAPPAPKQTPKPPKAITRPVLSLPARASVS